MRRREFIRTSALIGGGLGIGITPGLQGCNGSEEAGGLPGLEGTDPGGADRALRILVLGGTGFIGPHTLQYALERGHTVSMFNRGRSNPDIFPEVERLIGDRNDDLSSLEGREWDVVIDNHATNPRWVRDSAQLLSGSVDRYVFISTLSVYPDNSVIGLDEGAANAFREGVNLDTEADDLPYGVAKSIAEAEAEKAFPGRTTIVRPGLIVGPGDSSDRFTYWPVRIARGGEVLAPGDGTDPTQIIDARDLTSFVVHMAEQDVSGIMNAVGPETPLPMGEMLETCKEVSESDATLTWVPADFLTAQGVRGWSHMPTWVPDTPEMAGFSRFSNSRALELGLTFRPLEDTVRDTLDWNATRPAEDQVARGNAITPEREAEVLAAWHAQGG